MNLRLTQSAQSRIWYLDNKLDEVPLLEHECSLLCECDPNYTNVKPNSLFLHVCDQNLTNVKKELMLH